MFDPAILSIVVLILLFVAAMWNRVHLGLLCFPVAYLVGAYAGISADEITSFFPASFVILVVGVMSIFAIAESNGTVTWLLTSALRLVGGRVWRIPWLTFLVGVLLTGLGTLPAAAVAVMAPISIGFARRYGLPPLLMVLAAVTGIVSGGFSPIAVYGLTALELYDKANIQTPQATELYMLLAFLGTGILLTAIYTLVARRVRRTADEAPTGAPSEAANPTGTSPTPGGGAASVATLTERPSPLVEEQVSTRTQRVQRVTTLTVMILMVVGTAVFDLDLGYVAFGLAVILQLAFRIEPGQLLARIPWGVIILIAGILTYIGVMEAAGAFSLLSDLLMAGGSAIVGLLMLCYIAGVTSFFASSIAVLATVVPLLPPLIEAGINPVAALITVALTCVMVDLNPLGITGGLFLSSTPEEGRTRLFRQLLLFGGGSVAVAPALVWAAFAWI